MRTNQRITELEKQRNENFLNYASGTRSKGEFLLFMEIEEQLKKELQKIENRA